MYPYPLLDWVKVCNHLRMTNAQLHYNKQRCNCQTDKLKSREKLLENNHSEDATPSTRRVLLAGKKKQCVKVIPNKRESIVLSHLHWLFVKNPSVQWSWGLQYWISLCFNWVLKQPFFGVVRGSKSETFVESQNFFAIQICSQNCSLPSSGNIVLLCLCYVYLLVVSCSKVRGFYETRVNPDP